MALDKNFLKPLDHSQRQNRYCIRYMVKASSQIERELSLLQQRTQALETSLEPLYEGYLKALSEASGRQLVMAAFHICTKAYPSKFLSLSLQQRSQLQQEIQSLSGGLYQQLVDQREKARKASRRPAKNGGLAFLQRLLEAKSSGAAIVATDGSRESLLEKLSALGLSDSDDEQESEDWSGDVPTAEDDGLDSWAASDSEDERNETQGSDRVYDGIDIFESGFEVDAERQESQELFGRDELSEKTQGDSVDEARGELEGEPPDDFSGNMQDDSLRETQSDRDSSERQDIDFELDVPPAEQRLTLTDENDLLSALEGLAARSVEDEKIEDEVLAPIHLVRQQMLLEKAIRKVFEQVSEQANDCLQKAKVMPSFPKGLNLSSVWLSGDRRADKLGA